MKQILIVLFFLLAICSSNAQVQKNSLHGKIIDSEKNILPGASVIIPGTKLGVNANESGEYLFDKLPAGFLPVICPTRITALTLY